MEIKTQINESRVSWDLDGFEINGTITYPEGNGPFPVVVMVAGSGPTDRDWNSPLIPGTNGSARLLANNLTGKGYVTLRYDKRASGPQAQENFKRLAGKISMQDHLDELSSAVEFASKKKYVDSRRIYALTNSEGCIHALNYQITKPRLPFSGLVLTSAPARPVGKVAHEQIERQLKSVPNGEKWLAAYDAAMDEFVSKKTVHVDENLPDFLRSTIQGITNPINQPFARELWLADPSIQLAKVNVPVLIVIGKKDIQVDWQADGVVFEEIARNHSNITVEFAENANHVLKYEPLERKDINAVEAGNSYNADDRVLDQDVIEIIDSWLRKN